MEKAFELFMADEGENHTEAYAKLLLPASPCELKDALEKAEITPDRPVYLEIQKYALEMECLKPYIGVERELPSLYAFNALAEKLITLDGAQRLGLAEQLKNAAGHDGGPVPLPRVYDLAAGDGAFARLNLLPPEPDYTVLLKIRQNENKTVRLKLPMPPEELDGMADAPCQCVDCRVPILINAITMAGTVSQANEAALTLNAIPEGKRLTRYKALLEAKGFASLREVLELYDTLDEYSLEADIRCPEDAGRKEVRLIISSEEVEKVIPHVNLLTYGQQSMAEYNMVLTGYGGFCRIDGKPFRNQS